MAWRRQRESCAGRRKIMAARCRRPVHHARHRRRRRDGMRDRGKRDAAAGLGVGPVLRAPTGASAICARSLVAEPGSAHDDQAIQRVDRRQVERMRVWFDLSNSPHINLFVRMIRELEAERHQVVITCRPLANTIDLLDLHGLRYEVVGIHYGGRFAAKAFGYPVRIWQLWRYLKPLRIDVAISQSSFHSPLVAWLLGVRSIYMNDNEHAMGNIPSFLFA